MYVCCVDTAAEQHPDEDVAVNSQPLGEMNNRQPTTYEELDLGVRRDNHDYCDVTGVRYNIT